jgi:hypothetical protein
MVTIFHPVTRGAVDVAPESLWHYRQSGWVTREEWDELQAQRAAQEAAAARQVRKPADKEK